MMFVITYAYESEDHVEVMTGQAVTEAISKTEAREVFLSHPTAKARKATIIDTRPFPNTSSVFLS